MHISRSHTYIYRVLMRTNISLSYLSYLYWHMSLTCLSHTSLIRIPHSFGINHFPTPRFESAMDLLSTKVAPQKKCNLTMQFKKYPIYKAMSTKKQCAEFSAPKRLQHTQNSLHLQLSCSFQEPLSRNKYAYMIVLL